MSSEMSSGMKTLSLVLLPLVTFAVAVSGQSGGFGSSPGSLFSSSGYLADSTRDLRANRAGDVITILVTESASAVASGATNTARKSSAKNTITSLAGTLSTGNPLANLADLSNTQQLQGTGQTSRSLTLATTLSATVIDVTPNGMLVVEGSKDVSVNSERQSMTVRGMVRPVDLSTANTIPSTRVADLQVRVNGKGEIGRAHV